MDRSRRAAVVRQAFLADRLSGVPFDAVWHSPLERASQTARAVAERMPSLSPQPSALLFDCVPSGMTPETPAVFEPFFGSVTEAEVEAGQRADGRCRRASSSCASAARCTSC